MNSNHTDIDAYLAAVPDEARATLEGLRRTIRAVAPAAVESISYGMPAFKYQGKPLIYFAAAKNHCAIYGPAIDAHRDELAGYSTSRGTIRFPPDQPLPEALVQALLRERIEAIEAAAGDRKRKKSPAGPSG